jgi:hypothetical protein
MVDIIPVCVSICGDSYLELGNKGAHREPRASYYWDLHCSLYEKEVPIFKPKIRRCQVQKRHLLKKNPTLAFEYLLLDPWCFLPAVSRGFPYAVNSFIGSFIDPCKRLYNSNIFQPNTEKQHITKFDSPLFPVFKPSRRAFLHHFRSVSLILRQHNDSWVGECMSRIYVRISELQMVGFSSTHSDCELVTFFLLPQRMVLFSYSVLFCVHVSKNLNSSVTTNRNSRFCSKS